MMTIADRIAHARNVIAAAGVRPQDAALDAELLARTVLQCDRAALLVRLRDEEPPEFSAAFAPLVERRSLREPMAYIVGEREFWGRRFAVMPGVLIPRPETELIVEAALDLFRETPPGVVIDVGTGSGCLAVSLAAEFPAAHVVATDISMEALAIARRNAAANGLEDRIDFRLADLLDNVADRADLIVSNPPYVASGDAPGLVPEVREHEPHVALFAGHDGLHVYRRLFPSVKPRLLPGGRLILEVGYDQDGAVIDIASRCGWTFSHHRQDLQGITRTLVFHA
jgi:release factor glutamine methyltransferase